MVSPYNEAQLQPHSYDCILGSNFREPNINTPGDFHDIEEKEVYILKPLSFALAHTEEIVDIPLNVVGFVCGRSTIARNTLTIESAGLLDAGFSGQVTLELFNAGPWPLYLRPGIKICQLYFHEAEVPEIKFYNRIGSYNKQRGAKPPVFTLTK